MNNNVKTLLILPVLSITAVLLLPACAAPDIKPCGASRLYFLGAPPAADAFDPFEYHNFLKSLDRNELSRERDYAIKQFEESDRASNRVRLALILSLPNSSGQNLTYARSLLEDAGSKISADCDPAFTEYLSNQISAREKEANWARSLLTENKTMRKTLDTYKSRLGDYKDQLGTYKEEAQTKTQQLEQLKQIEENINKRDDPNLLLPKKTE